MVEEDARASDELELFRDPATDVDLDDESLGRLGGRRHRKTSLIVVTGAKGGVGKSLLSANLAIYLATIGRRVVVVDADPTGANVHTFLGAPRPNGLATYVPPLPSFRRAVGVNIDAFGPASTQSRPRPNTMPMRAEPPRKPRAEAGQPMETAVPGLLLLHAGLDEPIRGRKRKERRTGLAERLHALDAEYVVVDAGAGLEPALLDLYLAADVTLFLSLPEPTAIENTYAFVRAAFARHVRAKVTDRDERARLVAIQRKLDHVPAPLDLVRKLEADGDPLAVIAREALDAFHFRIAFNQTRLRADLDLGDRMRSAALRRMGLWFEYLGYVDHDDTVWTCVRAQRPLLVESPGTKASKSIEKIARRLLAIDAGKARSRPERGVPPDTHHDLLEVQRGATDEEIRRAYKRAKEIYAPDALCRYGLFDDEGLAALRTRLDEAYDVLLDSARRRPYELSVFPPDTAPREERAGQIPEIDLPPAPPITPETDFRGPLLRAVRESKGLDVRDVCTKTKIGLGYVKAIEEDDYPSLPALVYVRGFVVEMSKILKLDSEQVARTYVKHYRRWLEEQERL